MSEGGITLLRHIRKDGSKARWHIPRPESAAVLDELDLPYEIEEFVPRSRLEKAEEALGGISEALEGSAFRNDHQALTARAIARGALASHPEEPK